MSLESVFKGNGRAGQVGEDYFGKALEKSGIGARYNHYRSLAVPDERTTSNVDCDFLFMNGNTLLPIDVKNTAVPRGRLYTAPDGTLMDGDGQPHHFQPSQSMHVVVDRYRRALPNARVLDPIIVIVPTDRNPRARMDLSDASWNGFQVLSSAQALTEIIRLLGRPSPVIAANLAFAREMIEKKKRTDAAQTGSRY